MSREIEIRPLSQVGSALLADRQPPDSQITSPGSKYIENGDEKVAESGENVAAVEENPDLFIDPAEEKRLLRKLDLFIISILGLLYLISFLDRSNIGNANVAGMSKDLGLVGNQFGTAVSVLYATYTTFEPVCKSTNANLLKIITPKILMSVSTLAWGVLTVATAYAKNFHGLVTIRVLLGATESGLFPCVNMYLLMSYRREEIARRLSFIYCCAALSGAFGGILAYGLTQVRSSVLRGWQVLYIVEGAITLAFAPIAYFLVPNRVDQSWFLTARQKDLCHTRLLINRRFYNPDEKFSWKEVKRGFFDWKTLIHAVNQFLINITLYAFTTFMPTIIRGLGYSTYNAQLMTVPAYVVAAGSFLTFGYFSDKYHMRSPFIALACLFAVIGYAILIAAPSLVARYIGLLFIAVGLYPSTALNLAWCSGNAAGHFKRATASGTMQAIGNCAGAAVGFIFATQTSPRYFRGLYVALGAMVIVMILVTIQALLIKRENARRRELVLAGAPDEPEKGDDNVHWQYWL